MGPTDRPTVMLTAEIAPEAWAMVGVVSGTILGWVGSALNARSARGHERTMANDERRHRRMEAVYLPQITDLQRIMLMVERTQPILEPSPAPPPPPTDDEFAQLQANGVLLSRDMQALLDSDWDPAVRRFFMQASILAEMRKAEGSLSWQQLEESYGRSVPAQWRLVDDERQKVRAALQRIKDVARSEMEGLPPGRGQAAGGQETTQNVED